MCRLALVVFISLNMSRVIFMKALIRINWRSLSPNLFEYVACIRRNGRFAPPKTLWGSSTIKQELRTEMNTILRRYELVGWVMLPLAFLMHIPWILLTKAVSENVQYDPSTDA